MLRWLGLVCLLGSCGALGSAGRAALDRPNIVLILVDDMGWGDLEPRGMRLPELDRLRAEGRRFDAFYVAQAVCSASRAALLTGCYPQRIGIQGALPVGSSIGLPVTETTLAEVCRARGYHTAFFGKWHLGDAPRFDPREHGFDEFYGLKNTHAREPGVGEMPIDSRNSTEPITRELTERAVDFIERQARQGVPFFLYLAHPMPRVPLQASAAFRGVSGRGLYADVLLEIDASVGALRRALSVAGLTDNTLFIFTSDHGPWLTYGDHAGSTGGLRGGKGSSFEGGVRVPCIMSWPGVIAEGSECAQALMNIDLLPSLVPWIGGELPELPIDGQDVRDLLTGVGAANAMQCPYYFWSQSGELEAMRLGRWKLHFARAIRSVPAGYAGNAGAPGRYLYGERIGLSLFDLAIDPGEAHPVQHEFPEVLTEMQRLAEGARRELGDALQQQVGSGQRWPLP